MRYFALIVSGIDVAPALAEVLSQPELWGERPWRSAVEGTPHAEVQDIWLRATVPGPDHREAAPTETLGKLPECRKHLYNAMTYFEADRLGRAYLSKLAPGGKIYPHRDIGPDPTKHYDTEAYWSRVHIVLQGTSHFYAADEVVEMNAGEMWWFDGSQEHWVENTGLVDRIHLFFDLRVT